MVPFVLLGAPRTGTTMLVSAINAAEPDIICFGEIFNEYLEVDGGAEALWGVSKATIEREVPGAIDAMTAPAILAQRFENPAALLDGIFGSRSDRAVGFKFLYDQRYYLKDQVSLYACLRKHRVRIIHLRRLNWLNQYYSLQMARRTNVWLRESGDEAPPAAHDPTLTVSIADFLFYAGQMAEQEATFSLLCKDYECIDVWYENVVAYYDSEMSRIHQFLSAPGAVAQPRTLKQNARPMAEVIGNYDEVKAAVAGTEFHYRILEP